MRDDSRDLLSRLVAVPHVEGRDARPGEREASDPHDVVALQPQVKHDRRLRELALEPRAVLEEQGVDLVGGRPLRNDDLDVPLLVDNDSQRLRTPRRAYRNLDETTADFDAPHASTVSVPSDN